MANRTGVINRSSLRNLTAVELWDFNDQPNFCIIQKTLNFVLIGIGIFTKSQAMEGSPANFIKSFTIFKLAKKILEKFLRSSLM